MLIWLWFVNNEVEYITQFNEIEKENALINYALWVKLQDY